MSEGLKSYYQPGPERASQVRALFSQIARRYDLINDVQSLGMHRRWKRKLVRLAQPKPGDRALDVCTGTGDIAFAMARSGAEVFAVDFTPGMLEVARHRDRNSDITFIQADAQKLPFAAGTFDIVSVAYGLRNLPSWQLGLAEMIRVLKPAGRVVILDFSQPTNPIWKKIYFAYLAAGLPVLGRFFARDAKAYAYILESLKHYATPGQIEGELRGLGCESIQATNFLGGAMSLIGATKR